MVEKSGAIQIVYGEVMMCGIAVFKNKGKHDSAHIYVWFINSAPSLEDGVVGVADWVGVGMPREYLLTNGK